MKKLLSWMKRREARRVPNPSSYMPFRGKPFLSLAESLRLVHQNMMTITLDEDTVGRYLSTPSNGTYGRFGMVKIVTPNQNYIMLPTPAGIRLFYSSTPSQGEEQMIDLVSNEIS
jgi:hypothetical protein